VAWHVNASIERTSQDKLQNRNEESGVNEARAKANANARAERNASGTISSLTMVQGKGDSKFDFQTPQVHRYTPEGLPVYKYVMPLFISILDWLANNCSFFRLAQRYFDLGMKQDDGGSGECPFDCSCCY